LHGPSWAGSTEAFKRYRQLNAAADAELALKHKNELVRGEEFKA
jgi:hypothetical protein